MPSAEPLGESDPVDSDSEVWLFFTKDDYDDEPVAVCNQNGCTFNADISDYDNMWNHLSVSHAEIYKGTTHCKTMAQRRPTSERADMVGVPGEAPYTGTAPPLGSSSEHGPATLGASPFPVAEKTPNASPKAEDEVGGAYNGYYATEFNAFRAPPKDDNDEDDVEEDADEIFDQLTRKKMADEKKHKAPPKDDDDEEDFENTEKLQMHFGTSPSVSALTNSPEPYEEDTVQFFGRLKCEFKKLADERKPDVLLKIHQALSSTRKPHE